ncbi:argininosuccinate lyase [Peptococcus simiae]|uniref:Argininosuccinate lyase n=1 Tax=Peptococcus simiae TaxID=1643805 RepID=A0ABW9GX75_9FIRM
MSKLWGGRFSKDSDHLMEDFHSSIKFDQKLYREDIRGSIAHADMLGTVGVLSRAEADTLIEGLKAVQADIEEGKVAFTTEDEDIHMNIERLLTAKVGDVGKKLHTGRSRNDQVAVDLRMYVRSAVAETRQLLVDLVEVLHDLGAAHVETIMPGYTHLQRAQPVTFAHHLLAYIQMFRRDVVRLDDWQKNNNIMPLGSGALAGTTYPLDRNQTAQALDFDAPCANSMDGVSDRDFVLDYLYAASVSMMHLSRLSEEVILWASQEFAFIDLDDAYSTGSSIMPQKKNPDVAELIRGKAGRVSGHLMAMLMTMKGLPLAYNKDMQEDKEGLFDAIETWQKCLMMAAPMLKTLKVKKENMRAASEGGFTNATDLADYLVGKGVAFRDAHRIVGELVAHALDQGQALGDLSLADLQKASPQIEEDIYEAISVDTCVKRRHTKGAPGFPQVEEALDECKSWLTQQQ